MRQFRKGKRKKRHFRKPWIWNSLVLICCSVLEAKDAELVSSFSCRRGPTLVCFQQRSSFRNLDSSVPVKQLRKTLTIFGTNKYLVTQDGNQQIAYDLSSISRTLFVLARPDGFIPTMVLSFIVGGKDTVKEQPKKVYQKVFRANIPGDLQKTVEKICFCIFNWSPCLPNINFSRFSKNKSWLQKNGQDASVEVNDQIV